MKTSHKNAAEALPEGKTITCILIDMRFHSPHFSGRAAADVRKGSAKYLYNILFLHAWSRIGFPPEKVSCAGLTSLWPEITRIQNIPLGARVALSIC